MQQAVNGNIGYITANNMGIFSKNVKNTPASAETPLPKTTQSSPPSRAANFSCRYTWFAAVFRVYTN